MKTAKPNRKKAAAGAEAPRRSVQSAKRAAAKIGGIPSYRVKVADQIRMVCSMFNGRIVGVSL